MLPRVPFAVLAGFVFCPPFSSAGGIARIPLNLSEKMQQTGYIIVDPRAVAPCFDSKAFLNATNAFAPASGNQLTSLTKVASDDVTRQRQRELRPLVEPLIIGVKNEFLAEDISDPIFGFVRQTYAAMPTASVPHFDPAYLTATIAVDGFGVSVYNFDGDIIREETVPPSKLLLMTNPERTYTLGAPTVIHSAYPHFSMKRTSLTFIFGVKRWIPFLDIGKNQRKVEAVARWRSAQE